MFVRIWGSRMIVSYDRGIDMAGGDLMTVTNVNTASADDLYIQE